MHFLDLCCMVTFKWIFHELINSDPKLALVCDSKTLDLARDSCITDSFIFGMCHLCMYVCMEVCMFVLLRSNWKIKTHVKIFVRNTHKFGHLWAHWRRVHLWNCFQLWSLVHLPPQRVQISCEVVFQFS